MQQEGIRQESDGNRVGCVIFLLALPVIIMANPIIGLMSAPIWATVLILLIGAMVESLDPERHPLIDPMAAAVNIRASAMESETTFRPIQPTELVDILRGGEFVGNRLKFKVKVMNRSKYVVTDVTVSLVSYPRDALTLEGPPVKVIAKIDPSGFVSPTFDFLPSKDCIKGAIVASVSYVDDEGKPHLAMTEPFSVRAVCDLLMPEVITSDEFEVRLSDFNHEEMTFKVQDWTPEEMRSKTLQVFEKLNFSHVTSSHTTSDEHVELIINGWARGKYTGKNLGVEVVINGRPAVKGATCTVRMSGQDDAMILPAIDEMSQKLIAWLCPMCGGEITAGTVSDIREGRQAKCPFCGVSLSR